MGRNKTFYRCSKQFGPNHLQSCPAKICLKYAKRGHFAKLCRSTNVKYMQETNKINRKTKRKIPLISKTTTTHMHQTYTKQAKTQPDTELTWEWRSIRPGNKKMGQRKFSTTLHANRKIKLPRNTNSIDKRHHTNPTEETTTHLQNEENWHWARVDDSQKKRIKKAN